MISEEEIEALKKRVEYLEKMMSYLWNPETGEMRTWFANLGMPK